MHGLPGQKQNCWQWTSKAVIGKSRLPKMIATNLHSRCTKVFPVLDVWDSAWRTLPDHFRFWCTSKLRNSEASSYLLFDLHISIFENSRRNINLIRQVLTQNYDLAWHLNWRNESFSITAWINTAVSLALVFCNSWALWLISYMAFNIN